MSEDSSPAQRLIESAQRAGSQLYSLGEEIAHGVSHGLGALLAVAGLTGLVARAAVYGHARDIVASAVFGAALVLMYTASTLFHSIPLPRTKQVLRVVDHCLIYVLIAGTYTPFALITLHGSWGWSLLACIWTLAIVGVGFKIFTTGRFEMLSLAIYLGMGWCGIIVLRPLLHALAVPGLWLLLVGGLCYTVGVAFYSWRQLRYHHAIWHLFVLAGSICHYFAVLLYALPSPSIA